MRLLLADIRAVTDREAKFALIALVPLSVLAALFELLGVVLVVPLLAVLSGTGGTGQGIVDQVADFFGTDDRSTLATILALCVLVAFVLKTLITLGIKWWSYGALAESEARTSIRLFGSYLFAPYSFHAGRSSAEALRNLTESVPIAYQQALTGIVGVVSEGAVVIIVTLLVVVAAPIAALGLMAYFAVVGFVYGRVVLRRTPRLGQRYQTVANEGLVVMTQSFGAIKQIIAANKQPTFADRFGENRKLMAMVRQKVQFVGEVPRLYLELAFVIGVVLLTLAIVQLEDTDRALGILVLFFAAGLRLLPALNRLFNAVTSVRVGRAALRNVAEINGELRTATRPRENCGDVPQMTGPIRLDDVTFSYPAAPRPALDGVSITIQRGSTVGVVGPSGAGKSTLVDLLLALHQPNAGRLLVGDADIDAHPEAWRDRVGLVPQDVYLLDAPLRENIAFGDLPDQIDDNLVTQVVAEAELTDLVASLPEGLGTSVGERGVRLSGGQKQRVGIARALYRRPELLLLDEATSALDTITEQRITRTIEALHGHATIVIVAHRLSTVRYCDQIVFLVEGRVKAFGPFDELARSEPMFAELVRHSELVGHESAS
jgi:ATP-binding cassette, subfamily B, bacterial PglK